LVVSWLPDMQAADWWRDARSQRKLARRLESVDLLLQEMATTQTAAFLHRPVSLRAQAGDRESVERMLLDALAAGEIRALDGLAELREIDNDPVGARNIRRSGITADGAPETKRNKKMILGDAIHELRSRLDQANRRSHRR
jgi:hypothetical protein